MTEIERCDHHKINRANNDISADTEVEIRDADDGLRNFEEAYFRNIYWRRDTGDRLLIIYNWWRKVMHGHISKVFRF